MIWPKTQEDWKYVNTFADWVAAFGSIFASLVALYLSRTNHVKVKIDISLGALVGLQPKPLDNLLIISVVNHGIRPATITGIGIRCGLFFKRKFMLIGGGSHPGLPFPQVKLPYVLEDGKKLEWLFITGTKDSKDQIMNFAKAMAESGFNSRLKIFNMKIVAYTSIGKSFSATMNKEINNRIFHEIKNLVSR